MIGFNHIGRLGQLGNQMFQYAAVKGIARNRGYDFKIPNHKDAVNDGIGNMLRTELFDAFDISQDVVGFLETEKYVQEPHYEFSEELFNNCPDNVSLVGFFQTQKYFKHIKKEIKKDFKFKKQIRSECADIIDEVFDDPIALHIRRGDFLINAANHHNLTLDYYEHALKKFHHTRQVVIFTDDPDWVGAQDVFKSKRFIVSQNNGAYHDMYMMSKCTDFIIANSTFSWWAAWLCENEDKMVVCPSKWFGVNNQDKNTKDLYPKGWLML